MDDATLVGKTGALRAALGRVFQPVPFLGYLFGLLICVLWEKAFGLQLAELLGLAKMPVFFGLVTVFKVVANILNFFFKDAGFDLTLLLQIPKALIYFLIIYMVPFIIIAKLIARPANDLLKKLQQVSFLISILLQLILLYGICHIWSSMNDYRLIALKLTLIAVLLTLSLNLINGYMGEFSCSHPGFMAIGAYVSTIFTAGLFTNNQVLGPAVFQWSFAYLTYPLALFIGGVAAALGALIVAIPSFKTRGDYLAIISLAFLFIVKSFFENMQSLGGARGISGQPGWSTLPMIFLTVIIGIWTINNFVTSTIGKALNAVRDDEIAADAMTVDTRKTKMAAFLFGAFWAGVSGGLLAHVLSYINPAMFGIQKLAEVLAMVYFGGLNSVYGSMVGAVSISLLIETLRPLEILKWIVIPLLLILVMIYRPTGLIAFKEFKIGKVFGPKED